MADSIVSRRRHELAVVVTVVMVRMVVVGVLRAHRPRRGRGRGRVGVVVAGQPEHLLLARGEVAVGSRVAHAGCQ